MFISWLVVHVIGYLYAIRPNILPAMYMHFLRLNQQQYDITIAFSLFNLCPKQFNIRAMAALYFTLSVLGRLIRGTFWAMYLGVSAPRTAVRSCSWRLLVKDSGHLGPLLTLLMGIRRSCVRWVPQCFAQNCTKYLVYEE